MDMRSYLRIPATDRRPVGWIAGFIILSWLGLYIHNRIELPQISLLSPENSSMALLAIILFLIWWWVPSRRIPAVLLLVLGMVHLVGGGIISVMPFKFLPYSPEQSLQPSYSR
jgi:prepilin signal peptidase PulO-like enzyme (type II secretory pathway)